VRGARWSSMGTGSRQVSTGVARSSITCLHQLASHGLDLENHGRTATSSIATIHPTKTWHRSGSALPGPGSRQGAIQPLQAIAWRPVDEAVGCQVCRLLRGGSPHLQLTDLVSGPAIGHLRTAERGQGVLRGGVKHNSAHPAPSASSPASTPRRTIGARPWAFKGLPRP